MSATITTSSRPARKARVLEWVSSVALAVVVIAGAFMVARTWFLNDRLVKGLNAADWVEVRTLIRAGADPRLIGKNGVTCLMLAAGANDIETLDALLEKGHEVDARDLRGFTALAQATAYGNTEAAVRLLSAGANANSVDTSGWTPLFWAVWSTDHSTVDAILRHGADPNLKNASGATALMWNSARLPMQLPSEPSAQDLASIQRWLNSLRAAAARMTGPNLLAEKARLSPQKVRIARLLLQHGADARVLDGQGRSALSEAVDASEDELADLLRRHIARSRSREKSSQRRR